MSCTKIWSNSIRTEIFWRLRIGVKSANWKTTVMIGLFCKIKGWCQLSEKIDWKICQTLRYRIIRAQKWNIDLIARIKNTVKGIKVKWKISPKNLYRIKLKCSWIKPYKRVKAPTPNHSSKKGTKMCQCMCAFISFDWLCLFTFTCVFIIK